MLKVVAGVLIRPPTCHALLPNVPDWIISCGVSARAVILGILSACLLCLATITNNHLIHQTHLVGHQMPVFVFGMLILFVGGGEAASPALCIGCFPGDASRLGVASCAGRPGGRP